jgi:hypothetical protein
LLVRFYLETDLATDSPLAPVAAGTDAFVNQEGPGSTIAGDIMNVVVLLFV